LIALPGFRDDLTASAKEYTMAHAVAEGARGAGAHVDIKRVPELVPEDVARKSQKIKR